MQLQVITLLFLLQYSNTLVTADRVVLNTAQKWALDKHRNRLKLIRTLTLIIYKYYTVNVPVTTLIATMQLNIENYT